MIWRGIVVVEPSMYRALMSFASGYAAGAPKSGSACSGSSLSMLKIVLRDIHAIDDIAIYVDHDDAPIVLLHVSSCSFPKYCLLSFRFEGPASWNFVFAGHFAWLLCNCLVRSKSSFSQ